jgi:hypothetical protein
MATFDYRRRLTLKDQVPAVGAGLAVGAVAFYIARVFLQRTPLVLTREIVPESGIPPQPQPRPKVGRPAAD